MSNWRQEVADAITPIEGVNDATATLKWNIATAPDPYSPTPSGQTVVIQRTVSVKGTVQVDKRLVDGKNFTAGDWITEISFIKYQVARVPLSTDPQIISGGVVKTLEEMRPMTTSSEKSAYGFFLGVDTLTVGNDVWFICGVSALDQMNDDDTGLPVPAKLRLTLRK